jgi:ABC-type amino acid transport substrate-binding protein
MRGDDRRPDTMFSYVAPEHRISVDHPLRAIRAMVDTALRELSGEFARLYPKTGRPSSGNGLPWLVLGALSALLCFVATGALAQQPDQSRGLTTRLDGSVKVDFDGLVQRRVVRVVVPHSRTLYFNDKGHERGISADFVRDFERYINQKYKKQLGKRPITVIMRPTTREVLLTNVAEGLADMAIGNLTVTEERLKLVDLVAPGSVQPVSELVLSGPKSPPITAAEELSGKTVHVRESSSYYESLLALNDRLRQTGKPPANLVLVPDALEDEDMMEMLNAGILEAIVVDDWKARMWAQVLPRMKVNPDPKIGQA